MTTMDTVTSIPINPFALTVTRPPRRLQPEQIAARHEDVADLARRIERAGIGLDERLAGINIDLTDPAKAKLANQYREEYAAAVAPLAERLAVLRDELASQAAHYDRDSIRARALFGDDNDPQKAAVLGSFWLARLEKASVVDLTSIAHDAASRFDVALCLAVENEVAHRGLTGDVAEEIKALVASVPMSPSDIAVNEKIAGGYATAELTRLDAMQRASGRSLTVERLQAAFDAAALTGKPKVPKEPSPV
jgi:hypothetical protein